MMRAPGNGQPQLFSAPVQRRRKESERIYLAVLHLRRCGFRIRRNGSHHVVDGKRLSLGQLMMLANSAGAGNPQ